MVGDARGRARPRPLRVGAATSTSRRLPSARDTISQRPPSCWNASRPIAFSPSVRSSPALADSNRLRATWRRRSGDMPRPTSSTAITARAPRRRRRMRIRSPAIPHSAYSSAALETNSLSASFGSWYAWPDTSTALARLPMRSRTISPPVLAADRRLRFGGAPSARRTSCAHPLRAQAVPARPRTSSSRRRDRRRRSPGCARPGRAVRPRRCPTSSSDGTWPPPRPLWSTDRTRHRPFSGRTRRRAQRQGSDA